MTGPPRSGPELNDKGPGRRPHESTAGLVVLALVLGIGGPLSWLMSSSSSAPQAPPAVQPAAAPTPPPSVTVVAAAPAAASPAPADPATPAAAKASAPPQIPRHRDPHGDLTPDIADFINPGEVPTMAEVIARLHAAGVRSGLGAFSPPGTRPPLIGLAVPESFELPPGYVRHYQATDDGQRIEPILMFSPDLQLVDAAGQPVALPADRVVPPEMAPPGLPIRRIVVPAPLDPRK